MVAASQEVSAEFKPFIVANDALGDRPRLREMMRDNGYLFVRNAAPRDRLLDLRRQILELCRDAGWVDTKSDLLQGKWSGAGPFTEGEQPYMEIYKKIVNLPAFISFPEDPALTGLVGRLFDGEVLCHRLRIGRVTFPNNTEQTTGMHQDWQYIHGTPETYTVWMPLGDCPVELGGLSVLRGSHRGGFIEHRVFDGHKYAAAGVPKERLPHGSDVEWHAGNFNLGDVLVFHSHTIHRALPNLTKDRLRLSVDNRYQMKGEAVEEHSMKSHYGL